MASSYKSLRKVKKTALIKARNLLRKGKYIPVHLRKRNTWKNEEFKLTPSWFLLLNFVLSKIKKALQSEDLNKKDSIIDCGHVILSKRM